MQYELPGVQTNCIMPGFINTPMAIETIIDKSGIDRADLIRMGDASVPMNHMGDAWDVAYAALFLASDESKFITGISLAVDGGQCFKNESDSRKSHAKGTCHIPPNTVQWRSGLLCEFCTAIVNFICRILPRKRSVSIPHSLRLADDLFHGGEDATGWPPVS